MELINDFRVMYTVLAFVAFLGIVAWAYSGKRKKAFDEAARLPFADDEFPAATVPDKQAERK